MAKRKKESKREKIASALDLPKDIVFGLPRFIFTGDRELFIEQFRGIVEYSPDLVKLSAGEAMLCVKGKGIEILCITNDEIVLGGKMIGMDFV